MSIALPPGPQPAPARQVTVGTAVFGAAIAALIGGMLATWLKFREAAPLRTASDGVSQIKDWLPANVKIPEVAANVMLITFAVACVMAQWAAYASRRNDRGHAAIALGLTALMGLAALNSQIYIISQIGLGVAESSYSALFFTITGVVSLLIAIGVIYSATVWFRVIGGRVNDTDSANGHALYWYILTTAFVAVWFVVYVQK